MMVGTSAMAELIIYTIDISQQNIGILTSDPDLHKNLVLVMYNMSYSGVVSSVPFLVIIIVFAPVRTTDQCGACY